MYRSLGLGAGTLAAGATLAVTGKNPFVWVLVALAMLVIGFVLLRIAMARGQVSLADAASFGPPSSGAVRGPGRH